MAKNRLFLRLISLGLILSFFMCALSSCERRTNRIFYEYFDTVTVIYDYSGGSQRDFDKNCELIEELVSECHELYDIYNEYEGIINIATINKNAGGGPLKVDEKIIGLLEFSLEMYSLTEGKVNVAMGSVLSLWHELRTEGVRIPTEEELRLCAEHTDPADIVIDRENSTVALLDPEMSLDVGAVAKGYVAELCAEMLRERGVSGYALDFGGNLRLIGSKADGGAWTVGIKNPDLYADEKYVRRAELHDGSLVTSGVYERFYTVDGVDYHHIIDTDTLMPGRRYLSVSVATRSSALADALSTALFNMELDAARELVVELGGAEATFVLPSGEVVVCGSFDNIREIVEN